MDLVSMIQTCGLSMTISGIVLAVLGAIAVAVSFAVRKAFKVQFGADDWWILAAAIAHLALQGIQGWGATIGRDAVSLEDSKLSLYLKVASPSRLHTMSREVFTYALASPCTFVPSSSIR